MMKKILIVEDDALNYEILKTIVNRDDVIILWAKNGKDAIDQFNTNPDIGAIFMDVRMPIMNGSIAAMEIKKINEIVPIIGVSAYKRNEIDDNYFDSYVQKPIVRHDIMDAIENHIKEVTNDILKREEEKTQQWIESEKESLKVLNGVSKILELSDFINKSQSNDVLKKLDEIKSLLENKKS